MSNSRTFKAALLGSGKFMITLTGLASSVVLTRILTKIDYAAYRQTLLTYTFAAPFLSLGLPMALYYFLPNDTEHGRSTLTGNLIMLFGMGVLFLGFMWCGGNSLIAKRFNNPALSELLLIFAFYPIFVQPIRSIDSCLISCNRVKTLTIFNVSNRLIVFIFVIGLALILRSPYGPIIGDVAAEFLLVFPALFLMYRAIEGKDWLPNKKNMWKQVKYGVPLGISSTIGTISAKLDKVLVSSLCSPEEFAIYVNGAMEIPLIGVITGSVMSILIPEFADMYQREKYADILSLWHRAMLKCALLIFPIMIFLMAMAPEVMRVLFSAKYADSALPFRIYLLLLPIRITNFGSIFMASNNIPLMLFRTSVGLVLNFFLSIFLINLLGYIGAAIGTVIVMYMWGTLFNLYFIGKILKVGIGRIFPYRKLAHIFLINMLVSIIFIPKMSFNISDLAKLGIWGPLFTLLVGLFYYNNKWIYITKGKISLIKD